MICNIFKSDTLNFLVDSVLVGIGLIYLEKKSPQITSLILPRTSVAPKERPVIPFEDDNFFMMK